VFLGTHTPRLDDKGRLFLPAKFRDRLAGGLVTTPGPAHVDRKSGVEGKGG
jgi:MraZ protein